MPMTLTDFSKRWLEKHGLLNLPTKQDDGTVEYIEAKYDEAVGKAALEVIDVISKQGHSGTSVSILWTVLQTIFTAYDNPQSEIWHDFFLSEEGLTLQRDFAGKQFIYPEKEDRE